MCRCSSDLRSTGLADPADHLGPDHDHDAGVDDGDSDSARSLSSRDPVDAEESVDEEDPDSVEQPFADEEDEDEAWQQAASRRAGHAISLHSCERRLPRLLHLRLT